MSNAGRRRSNGCVQLLYLSTRSFVPHHFSMKGRISISCVSVDSD
jgi:hypothetical protein